MNLPRIVLAAFLLALVASVASAAPPAAPRLHVYGGDNDNGTLSAFVNWYTRDSSAPSVAQYNIYVSTDGGTSYSMHDSLASGLDSFSVYQTYNFITSTEGTYNFYVTAKNDDGESAPSNVVAISLAFRPLRFTHSRQWSDSIALGTTYTFDVNAVPSNPAETVNYGIMSNLYGTNPEATVDAATGEVSWTPTTANGAEFVVFAWLVSDPSKRDSVRFFVTVSDPNGVDFTSLRLNARVDSGQTVTHVVTAVSRAGATVTYQMLTMTNASTIDVSLNATTGALALTPHAYGTYEFSIGAYVSGDTAPRAVQNGFVVASDPNSEPLTVVGDVLDSLHFGQIPSTVYAYRRTSTNPVDYTVVDSVEVPYNFFYFRDLPGGAYIFYAVPHDTVHTPGYYRANDYASLTWDDATVVSGGRGLDSVVIMLDFVNGDGHNLIRGGVNSSSGQAGLRERSLGSVAGTPLEGATVYAVDATGRVQGMDVTDMQGNYEIGGLGASTFTVLVDRIGFAATTTTVTFAEDNGGEKEVDVNVQKVGSTSGVVLDPVRVERATVAPTPTSGAAALSFEGVAGGAALTVQGTDGRTVQHSTMTTTAGRNLVMLQTDGLEAGTYIVRITMPNRVVAAPLVIVR